LSKLNNKTYYHHSIDVNIRLPSS